MRYLHLYLWIPQEVCRRFLVRQDLSEVVVAMAVGWATLHNSRAVRISGLLSHPPDDLRRSRRCAFDRLLYRDCLSYALDHPSTRFRIQTCRHTRLHRGEQ